MDGYGSSDDDGFGDGAPPRDFFSQLDSFGLPASSSHPIPGSSSLNRTGLDFGSLDLNSNAQWPDMQGFQHLLQPGGAEVTQTAAPVAPPASAPPRPPAAARRGRGSRVGRGAGSDVPGGGTPGSAISGGGSVVLGGGSARSAVTGGGAARSTVAGGGAAVPGGFYALMPGAFPPVPPEYPYPPVVPCYLQYIAGYPPLPPGYPQYAPGAATAPVAPTTAPSGGSRRGSRRRVVGVDLIRGNWDPQDTKLFCELYVAHMASNGQISKAAWKEIADKFYLKTGKKHDQEQFKYRKDKLKHLWHWINDNLRKGTGLGLRPDGMIDADDSWWQAKAGGNKEILALKEGWPPYLEEMDMMFSKTAADGSTSYARSGQPPASLLKPRNRPASLIMSAPLFIGFS